MYGYTYSADLQCIVGTLETEDNWNKISPHIKDLEKLSVRKPETVYDDTDDIDTKIEKLFREARLMYNDRYSDGDKICIEISGDWKHEHMFCDDLMESLGYKLENEQTIGDSEDDCYDSVHTYAKA